jgi:preprotein translocase subunit SecG
VGGGGGGVGGGGGGGGGGGSSDLSGRVQSEGFESLLQRAAEIVV